MSQASKPLLPVPCTDCPATNPLIVGRAAIELILEILEPQIVTNATEPWIDAQVGPPCGFLVERFLKPLEGLIFIA